MARQVTRAERLDELIEHINAAGWLVTELYQSAEDAWTAALRQRGDFTSLHGTGETAVEALSLCWKRRTRLKSEAARNPTEGLATSGRSSPMTKAEKRKVRRERNRARRRAQEES